jgi:hypothetical protein
MRGALLNKNQNQSNATLHETLQKYADYRSTTYTLLAEEFFETENQKISITPINAAASGYFVANWENHPQRLVKFDWSGRLLNTLRTSHPKRLELAIWDAQNTLCGLVAGRVSNASIWLSVNFLEGNPDPNHPLKGLITPIAMRGAEIYSVLIADESKGYRPRVRVMNPVKGALASYAEMGYTEVKQNNKVTYLTKPNDGENYHVDTDRANS